MRSSVHKGVLGNLKTDHKSEGEMLLSIFPIVFDIVESDRRSGAKKCLLTL